MMTMTGQVAKAAIIAGGMLIGAAPVGAQDAGADGVAAVEWAMEKCPEGTVPVPLQTIVGFARGHFGPEEVDDARQEINVLLEEGRRQLGLDELCRRLAMALGESLGRTWEH